MLVEVIFAQYASWFDWYGLPNLNIAVLVPLVTVEEIIAPLSLNTCSPAFGSVVPIPTFPVSAFMIILCVVSFA